MSFIATGITAGLTALGMGSTMAGVLGAVGAGAGLGAGLSAATGGDPGKGALFGALGGGLTGGIGALAGAGSGTAGAAGAAADVVGGIKGAGTSFIEQAAREGIGAIPSASPAVGSTAQSLAATAAPTLNAAAAAPATSALSGGFTGFGNVGDFAAKELGTNLLQSGTEGIGQSLANAQTERESEAVHNKYFSGVPGYSGFATGGAVQHAAKEGGSIRLTDGDFIVPADVVSALGNGSSTAGAKYLTHLMRALESGPPPEAGALANARMSSGSEA